MDTSESSTETPNIVFDAKFVAPCLGLTAEQLMAEIRKGTVYQVTERGVDDDNGRYRVIFRYRSKECRIVMTREGQSVSGV